MSVPPHLNYALSTVLDAASLSIPLPWLGMHIRPLAALVTVLIMSAALFLGFNASTGQYLPLHSDKVLHFLAFAAMTFGSYCTFYVSGGTYGEVWYKDHLTLLLNTAGWLAASILSEVLQGLLPSKVFQYGDILANLAGTFVGLCGAYLTQAGVRQRSQLSAIYFPLEAEHTATEDEYGRRTSV